MSSGEYIMDSLDPENFSSHWERCVKTGLFTADEVKDVFKKGLITASEYRYALDYLKGDV